MEIKQHEVWLAPDDYFNGLRPIGRFAHDLMMEVSLTQKSQQVTGKSVIFDNHDSHIEDGNRRLELKRNSRLCKRRAMQCLRCFCCTTSLNLSPRLLMDKRLGRIK
jgi:hypothetical protein